MAMVMASSALPGLTAEMGAVGPDSATRADEPYKVGDSDIAQATYGNGQRKVVRTDNGTLHAVLEENNEIYYTYSLNNGKDWSDPVNISRNAQIDRYPAIATNGTNLYIVWEHRDGGNGYLRYRGYYDDVDDWDPTLANAPTAVSQGWTRRYEFPAIAASGQYVVILTAWSQGSDREITAYRHTNYGRGGGWSGQYVTNNGNEDQHPSVAMDDQMTFVVWESDLGGDYEVWIAGSPDAGINWGGQTQLSTNSAPSRNPVITINGSRLFVAWEEQESGNWDIHYRCRPDIPTGWVPSLALPADNITAGGSADARYPSIVHEDNVTYLLWEDHSGQSSGDVFLSMNSTGTWGTAMDLTMSSEELWGPNAFINITTNRLDFVYTRYNGTAPHDVLYGFYALGNAAPTLSWTGETNYVSDGLDPEGDSTGHVYTYRVTYMDVDDDPPMEGNPAVYVDLDLDGAFSADELMPMDEDNATDMTYSDGKVYTYSTQFAQLGTFKYKFVAKDINNSLATGPPTNEKEGPTITRYNIAPELEWTEELGYALDGLEPEVGDVGDTYTYKVRYIDRYDEAPAVGFPKVLFDMNLDGDFDDPEDEEAAMLEAAPVDTTYYNGKIYYYERTFDTNGTFHYKMVVEDLIGLKDETDMMSGPEVSIPTQIPQLTWVDEVGYITDGVNPDRGSIYTDFVFKVNYSDKDNEGPRNGAVEIGVDLDDNGTFEASEWTKMTEVDPADDNFTDNKTYSYETKFALGTYDYRFRAWDLPGAMALGEATTVKQVLVDIDNAPPVLKWTNEENYTSDGLNPEVGTANLTEFVYRVRYEDLNNDMPEMGFPQVGIDLDMDDTFQEDEFFVMDEVSDMDDTVTDGKLYTFTHVFDSMGDYSYTFRATDLYADATGTPTGVFQGPAIDDELIITSPPTLDWVNETGYVTDGVEPNEGLSSDSFVFKVAFIDADNDLPAQGSPKVLVDVDHDGTFSSMSDWSLVMNEEDIDDMDVTDGKVFVRSVTFDKKGLYNYTFAASSVRTDEGGFASGILLGTVNITGENNAPVVSWVGKGDYGSDGIHPNGGIPGENFEYRVNYTDADDDPPAAGYPRVFVDLNGDGSFDPTLEAFGMMPLDQGDEIFLDGKVYHYFGLSFLTEGTFKYRFEVVDVKGTAGEALEGTGPVIQIPEKNDPPELRFVGTDVKNKYDGVEPVFGDAGDTFYFTIVYVDVDGDLPAAGNPRLILNPNDAGKATADSVILVLQEKDTNDVNVSDGKAYTVTTTLEEGDYRYSFDVINVLNQTAQLGPLDGPIVVKGDRDGPNGTPPEKGLGDLLWILVLVIAIIVCLVIGFLAGRGKRAKSTQADLDDAEPRYRESVPLSETSEEELEEGPPPEEEEEEATDEEKEDDGGESDE